MTEIQHPLLEWIDAQSEDTSLRILELEHRVMLNQGRVSKNDRVALARLHGRAEALHQVRTMAYCLISESVAVDHSEDIEGHGDIRIHMDDGSYIDVDFE